MSLTRSILVVAVAIAAWPATAEARNCGPGDPAGASFDTSLRSRAAEKWVAAEKNYTGANAGMLRARADKVAAWERFRVHCLGDQQIALKSLATGKWVTAEQNYTGVSYGMLRARADKIGPWERFRYLPVEISGGSFGDGAMALQSVASERLVTAEIQNSGATAMMLRARATAIGAWEIFTAAPLPVAPPPPQATPPPPSPTIPVPGGEVKLPKGCTPAGKGVLVRLKRKGGATARVRSVQFWVRPGAGRRVDRRPPFRARVGARLPPGSRARIYARIRYRVPGGRRTRTRTISRRVRICPT